MWERKEMQVLGISSDCHLRLKWDLAPQKAEWWCGLVSYFGFLFLRLRISHLDLLSCLVFVFCFVACG